MKCFLLDPAESQASFPMHETRRKHVESNFRGGSDLDFKTDKSRRPFSLVCTKNAASHERRLKQYHDDLKSLEMVQTLEKDV